MSLSSYQSSLRSAFRGLWSGAIDESQFANAMQSAIDRGLSIAWAQGARECGIRPADFTPQEIAARNRAITQEESHISEVAEFIEENSRENGGLLSTVFGRVDLWLNRYRDVRNQAKEMACKDEKLMWQLGATEEHCSTCPRLDGKVKRASFWLQSGIHPQRPPNDAIECGGWNCLCELIKTDRPISRGPLPRFSRVGAI